MAQTPPELLFRFFNEIGIIAQLSRTVFETRLPPGYVEAQFSVLNHLVRLGDGRTPLDLASAFQVPKTTMTHTLAVLERGGLVTMRPNPRDGRSKCVFVTDAGRTFREQALAGLAPDLADLAARLPDGAIEAALPLLETVRQTLDANRPPRRMR